MIGRGRIVADSDLCQPFAFLTGLAAARPQCDESGGVTEGIAERIVGIQKQRALCEGYE